MEIHPPCHTHTHMGMCLFLCGLMVHQGDTDSIGGEPQNIHMWHKPKHLSCHKIDTKYEAMMENISKEQLIVHRDIYIMQSYES